MLFKTTTGSYKLERIPKTGKGDLRAWDAADEYLLQTFYDEYISKQRVKKTDTILILNDAFGALSIALHEFNIHNWGDSYIAHLASQRNRKLNQIDQKPDSGKITYLPSTSELQQAYNIVLIKIPKTLALLEEQLHQLKPYITRDTVIIGAAMSKHIHTSTLKLFEKLIGSTTTSRAVKKARLIFIQNDSNIKPSQSPYPKIISDDSFKLQLSNYANVFSQDHLDIGTRFFLEQLKHCPNANHIIDLGCGNGALGVFIQRIQTQAQLHFIDESYLAIASAKENYERENPNKKASYYESNGLSQYSGEKPELILCNPPFHQAHSIGDQIAWEMFKQSHARLTSGAELWVVGNRHLAYHNKLKRLFKNCKTISSNKKFVILAAIKQ